MTTRETRISTGRGDAPLWIAIDTDDHYTDEQLACVYEDTGPPALRDVAKGFGDTEGEAVAALEAEL